MWLFTNRGFFSVVVHREHPHLLVVRARVREDRDRLRGELVDMMGDGKHLAFITVEDTPDYDYPFRLVVGRALFSNYVGRLIFEGLTYDNFKSEACRAHDYDEERQRAYHDVWERMAVFGAIAHVDEVAGPLPEAENVLRTGEGGTMPAKKKTAAKKTAKTKSPKAPAARQAKSQAKKPAAKKRAAKKQATKPLDET